MAKDEPTNNQGMTRRELERAQRVATFGTNIPNVKQKQSLAQVQGYAAKLKAAQDAGYTMPATGDTKEARLELFKSMQQAGRSGAEESERLRAEATNLGISDSGYRRALNKIPATATTPAATGTATTPAATGTATGTATAPAAPEPVSMIGDVPASEALSKLRERATAEASKITDKATREAAMPFGPTSAERATNAQVMKDTLATQKLNAGIASSTLPNVSTSGLRPLSEALAAPAAPSAQKLNADIAGSKLPDLDTSGLQPYKAPVVTAPKGFVDTTNAMADAARARIDKPYRDRYVEGFTSFSQMGQNATDSVRNLLRSLRSLPDKTNAAVERFRNRP